jgi:hypothetical protein
VISFSFNPAYTSWVERAIFGALAMLTASSLGKKAWMYTSSVDAVNLTRTCNAACSVENIAAKGYELVNKGVDVDDVLLAAYQRAGIQVVVYTALFSKKRKKMQERWDENGWEVPGTACVDGTVIS